MAHLVSSVWRTLDNMKPTTAIQSYPNDTLRSLDLEQAVLCTLLEEPHQTWGLVSDLLSDDAFTEPVHIQLFHLVRSVSEANPYSKSPLMASRPFVEALAKNKECFALVKKLQTLAADVSALRSHALKLQQFQLLRETMDVAYQLQQVALTGAVTETQETLGTSVVALTAIMGKMGQEEKCFIDVIQELEIIKDYLQDVAEPGPSVYRWNSGFRQIDGIVDGIFPDLISIESDTPFLDTQLALLMSAHFAITEMLPVLFISSRMSSSSIGQLLVSLKGGVAEPHQRNGQLSKKEWLQFLELTKQLECVMSLMPVEKEITADQLIARIGLKLGECGRLSMIVIDDILTVPELMRRSEQAHDQGRSVVQFYRRLSRDFQCPVVTVVPAAMAHMFSTGSKVHMRLEGMRSQEGPQAFPAKALVHISSSGFGHLGTAEIDFEKAHEVDA